MRNISISLVSNQLSQLLPLNIYREMFPEDVSRKRIAQNTAEKTRQSRYSLGWMQQKSWKHITKMHQSVYYPVRVQASCLGPGRVLFVSQILQEQGAFSETCRQTGGLKAPDWVRHTALKPTENSALRDQMKASTTGKFWKAENCGALLLLLLCSFKVSV